MVVVLEMKCFVAQAVSTEQFVERQLQEESCLVLKRNKQKVRDKTQRRWKYRGGASVTYVRVLKKGSESGND